MNNRIRNSSFTEEKQQKFILKSYLGRADTLVTADKNEVEHFV